MKTIIPNQLFKHGTETYEKGKSYDVSDEEAFYFTMNGWVGGSVHETMVITSKDVATLDIHDGQLGHTSEVK